MKLVWEPISPGETYAVYQRVNFPPRWAVVEGAEALTAPEHKPRFEGNGRFMVVANSPNGMSAPSKEQRLVNLANPMGIVLDDDGRRILRDSGHYMPLMFRPDNSAIGIFGTFHMGLGGAGDVARTKEGNLLITTSSRAPIRLLDGRAHFLPRTNVGAFGDAEMQFKDPTGITIDSSGRVWVCDTGNGRIQVLDDKLERVVAVAGSELGLKAPTKVVEIGGGRMFVVTDPDAGQVAILKFSGDKLIAGTPLPVPRPVYAAASETYLYVSDEGTDPQAPGRVLSFRIEGDSLKPAGSFEKDLGKPYGLAYDAGRNVLVVVDRSNRRLVNLPAK
jgi:DNA-binding beta-propeller fold protein YncE